MDESQENSSGVSSKRGLNCVCVVCVCPDKTEAGTLRVRRVSELFSRNSGGLQHMLLASELQSCITRKFGRVQ